MYTVYDEKRRDTGLEVTDFIPNEYSNDSPLVNSESSGVGNHDILVVNNSDES